MPVLKSHSPQARGAEPFSVRDIERSALELMAQARRRCEQMLEGAAAECQRLFEAARAEGHARGLAEGRDEGRRQGMIDGKTAAIEQHRQQFDTLLKTLARTLESIEQSRGRMLDQARTDVIRLAIEIARKVTGRLGACDPGVLVSNLDDALRLTVSKSELVVRIHPSQRSMLEELMPMLQVQWPAMGAVRVTEDHTVAPGGCVVSTPDGQIDADLHRQIDRIAAELLGQNDASLEETP